MQPCADPSTSSTAAAHSHPLWMKTVLYNSGEEEAPEKQEGKRHRERERNGTVEDSWIF